MKKQKGFTLIELLVVISIIGLLASIVLVALSGARQKARVAKRISDLSQMQKALELYYSDNNAYPVSGVGVWRSVCTAWTVASATNTVPSMVPTYMSSEPQDPSMTQPNQNCYLYRSDTGTDYKFLDYNITDMTDADIDKFPNFKDPQRNYRGTPLPSCPSSTDAARSLAVYTPGAMCSPY